MNHESALSPEVQHIVCHECDTTVRLPTLQHRQKAVCPTCGFTLTRYTLNYVSKTAALSIASLVFLLIALPFEFLGFSANGQEHTIGIISGLQVLVDNGYLFLAVVQLLSILLIPALVLIGLLIVCLSIHLQRSHSVSRFALKVVFTLLPWSMAEIFLIGVLVSLIKISSMADISLGIAFYAYIGFTLCMSATFVFVDKHQLSMAITGAQPTAKVVEPSLSIQQTWALLLTAMVLYVPANILPIMHTRFLGDDEPSTILGGVILLWQSGSYPIAMIIFIASVIVPVGKLVILSWLTYTAQQGWSSKLNERIFWYRVTEFIGRWSMVDIFVVAILVSLIQFGNTMSILPGPAAIAFCAVVILTMVAAMTFDTRLIFRNTDLQK